MHHAAIGHEAVISFDFDVIDRESDDDTGSRFDYDVGMGLRGICAHCGKAFGFFPSAPRSYCSRKCYLTSTESRRVKGVCTFCGKPFAVPASNARRYKRCSEACRRGKAIRRKCAACGKVFIAGAKRRSHCSEACRRPALMMRCAHCQREFRVVPAVAVTRRHCSFACYRRYQGPTSPESNMATCLDALGIAFEREVQIGTYSIDFMLDGGRTALEVDGSYWHSRTAVRDRRRDGKLAGMGITVIRVNGDEIQGLFRDAMVETVKRWLASHGKATADWQPPDWLPFPRRSPEPVIGGRGDAPAVAGSDRGHAA